MLLHVTEFPFLKKVNNIPFHVYTTFSLSIHPLMDIYVTSTSWLLWIMLLSTWVYKYLFEILFSILLDVHPGVVLLIIWNFHITFHSGCTILHSYQYSNFSTSLPTLKKKKKVTILMGVRWYLTVVLLCIPLLI